MLLEAVIYGCVSTDISPKGVRFDRMVADALRYTQEASSQDQFVKSMWVRAPLWIQMVPSSNWIGHRSTKPKMKVRILLELQI